eukprot:COSAG02_NODE_1157_length_14186_cov_11.986299_11_plen_74_part_00
MHASADLIRFVGRSIELPAAPDVAVDASTATANYMSPEPEEVTALSSNAAPVDAEDAADLHQDVTEQEGAQHA